MIDLLKEAAYGGCSAKVDPAVLDKLLAGISIPSSPEVMVGISGHDDAGVYRLSDEVALIFTTDFFPPMVSDPYTFGRIAAANALSDIYAMGGKPLLVLNLMHYPSTRLPLEGLKEILVGGQSAIDEAGAFTMGGHTIDDNTPQYGLAVLGTVHPDKLITNAGAKPGQVLILTKKLGVGVLIAGHRLKMAREEDYDDALRQMQALNTCGAVLSKYGVTGATDVTGFGLIGHGYELAKASGVVLDLEPSLVPSLPGATDLLDAGCIPGAAFRNIRYVGDFFRPSSRSVLPLRYLVADAQTSGGLLVAVDADKALDLLGELTASCAPYAAIIGSCLAPSSSTPPGTLLF